MLSSSRSAGAADLQIAVAWLSLVSHYNDFLRACVCVNEGFGSVQAVITGPRFLGLFHKQVNFPSVLLLCMHMHAHVCALGDLSGWKVQWKCKIL